MNMLFEKSKLRQYNSTFIMDVYRIDTFFRGGVRGCVSERGSKRGEGVKEVFLSVEILRLCNLAFAAYLQQWTDWLSCLCIAEPGSHASRILVHEIPQIEMYELL